MSVLVWEGSSDNQPRVPSVRQHVGVVDVTPRATKQSIVLSHRFIFAPIRSAKIDGIVLKMSSLSSSISARARDVARASNSCGRQWFSTSRASRAGSFFNLGGLGASREAQYLSKERGIPRTEYNSNIHLIRSSEVDPFAPVPGSSRAAADKAAARAAARAGAELMRSESRIAYDTRHLAGQYHRRGHCFPDGAQVALAGARGSLEEQLQALKEELAEAKRALYVASLKAQRASHGRSEPTMTSHLLSTVIIITVVYFIAKDVSARFAGSPRPVDEGPVRAQTVTNEVDEATAQRQRDAPIEEQQLAESGLTSFESQPETVETPRRSVLSGLFWART